MNLQIELEAISNKIEKNNRLKVYQSNDIKRKIIISYNYIYFYFLFELNKSLKRSSSISYDLIFILINCYLFITIFILLIASHILSHL